MAAESTYFEKLSEALVEALAPGLAGLYLHGSLALDDFVAGKSDVDFCAVVPELSDRQRRRLAGAFSPDNMPFEDGGFDIHVVTIDAARAADWEPIREMWLAIHPGWDFHVEGRAADHDMCLTFEMCRRHGRTLYGPDAKEFFAPVDREHLLGACKREIEEWQSYETINQWDSAALSACRAWWLLEEDELGSKTSAGRWALSRGFPVVERALAHRAGVRGTTPDQSNVHDLLLHVHTLLEHEL
jgi:hypothetical protein